MNPTGSHNLVKPPPMIALQPKVAIVALRVWRQALSSETFEFIGESELVAAVEEVRRDVRYVITDFPVELLVAKFREEPQEEGDIYIPPYQRKLAWTPTNKCYFIESMILRIPVPPIFFYDVDGRLEVVDGSQRVRTLAEFLGNKFQLEGLEKLEMLNGLSFLDLPAALQKRLNNTPLRSFVLDQGTDESTRIEMFRRLNTTGKKLQDAEIRKGAFQGPFLNLIVECAETPLFVSIAPRIAGATDPQSARQELVTRFFVYSNYYREFRHDVRKFLDSHVEALNTAPRSRIDNLRQEFLQTMTFIRTHYPDAFYRSSRSKVLPRVRFEAIAVGTCLALRENPQLAFQGNSWLNSIEFQKMVRTDASNSGPRLTQRVEFVRDRLLGR